MPEDPVMSVLSISLLLGDEPERYFLMENLNYRKKLKMVMRESSLERFVDLTSFVRWIRTLEVLSAVFVPEGTRVFVGISDAVLIIKCGTEKHFYFKNFGSISFSPGSSSVSRIFRCNMQTLLDTYVYFRNYFVAANTFGTL